MDGWCSTCVREECLEDLGCPAASRDDKIIAGKVKCARVKFTAGARRRQKVYADYSLGRVIDAEELRGACRMMEADTHCDTFLEQELA